MHTEVKIFRAEARKLDGLVTDHQEFIAEWLGQSAPDATVISAHTTALYAEERYSLITTLVIQRPAIDSH